MPRRAYDVPAAGWIGTRPATESRNAAETRFMSAELAENPSAMAIVERLP